MQARKAEAARSERALLDRLAHPGVERLCFTFQVNTLKAFSLTHSY